jgi:hypothetical protein
MDDSLAPEDPLAWNFYRNPRQPYDDFFATYILKPLKYAFVRKTHARGLADFSRELTDMPHRLTTVQRPAEENWFAKTVERLEQAGVQNLYDFLVLVPTRTQAQGYIAAVGIPQQSLMGFIDYFKQWWFPFPATLRQLVEEGDAGLERALGQLKALKIANSMSLLEAAAARADREALSAQSGVQMALLHDLVQRADVSRLPYTSGGAVKRLWAMGYRSLADIRSADPQDYSRRVGEYFAAGGKGTSFDAQMEHILTFLQDARHAPLVL